MEKSNQTKSVFTISGRHRFVACVILVILVSCATFAYLSYCYKQAQNDIVLCNGRMLGCLSRS